jgi:hypothetical protein
MPAFFNPNIEILPQGQRELWPLLHAGLGFLHSSRISQSSENSLSCVVPFAKGQAQISFFGGLSLNRVEDTLLTDDNRIHVASPLDVGG